MHTIRRGFTTLAVAALAACGAGPGNGLDTRTFRLEHLDPSDVAPLIEPYILSEGATIQAGGHGGMPVITVRERTEILDRIAATLEEYDQPKPTVSLSFQIIEADGFETSDTAITGVETALREVFRFHGYRLAARALIRGGEFGSFEQMISTTDDNDTRFKLTGHIYEVRGNPDEGTVHLSIQFADLWKTILATDLNIPVGETVVLGSGSGQPGFTKSTLILTVRPELSQ